MWTDNPNHSLLPPSYPDGLSLHLIVCIRQAKCLELIKLETRYRNSAESWSCSRWCFIKSKYGDKSQNKSGVSGLYIPKTDMLFLKLLLTVQTEHFI